MIRSEHLRPLELRDVDLIFRWRNSQRIREASLDDQVIDYDTHQQWIKDRVESEDLAWIYEIEGSPKGFIGIKQLKPKSCIWSFYIGETDQKGLGTQMVIELIELLFTQTKIESIDAQILNKNEKSLRLHENLGFDFIARETPREHLGESIDVLRYRLLKRVWQKIKSTVLHWSNRTVPQDVDIPKVCIGKRWVGEGEPPLIIAEMSANHNGSLEAALSLIDAAAEAGAGAFKLQTYTPEGMTLDLEHGDFVINDPKSLWKGRKLYDLYEEAQTPRDWHQPILDRCREKGLIAFSTPFSHDDVEFLESLDLPAYKVASFENCDESLIRKIARTGKPMIISTGMASIAEIAMILETIKEEGAADPILLKCTSTYPASPESSNIETMQYMQKLFRVQVGLSDHTHGIGVALASIGMGASVVEKHFILDREAGGVDSAFSIEPDELKSLCDESKRAYLAKGEIRFGCRDQERKSLQFRRTLYFNEDVKEGQTLSETMLRAIRPGGGIKVHQLIECLGKKLNKSVSKGTPLTMDLFD